MCIELVIKFWRDLLAKLRQRSGCLRMNRATVIPEPNLSQNRLLNSTNSVKNYIHEDNISESEFLENNSDDFYKFLTIISQIIGLHLPLLKGHESIMKNGVFSLYCILILLMFLFQIVISFLYTTYLLSPGNQSDFSPEKLLLSEIVLMLFSFSFFISFYCASKGARMKRLIEVVKLLESRIKETWKMEEETKRMKWAFNYFLFSITRLLIVYLVWMIWRVDCVASVDLTDEQKVCFTILPSGFETYFPVIKDTATIYFYQVVESVIFLYCLATWQIAEIWIIVFNNFVIEKLKVVKDRLWLLLEAVQISGTDDGMMNLNSVSQKALKRNLESLVSGKTLDFGPWNVADCIANYLETLGENKGTKKIFEDLKELQFHSDLKEHLDIWILFHGDFCHLVVEGNKIFAPIIGAIIFCSVGHLMFSVVLISSNCFNTSHSLESSVVAFLLCNVIISILCLVFSCHSIYIRSKRLLPSIYRMPWQLVSDENRYRIDMIFNRASKSLGLTAGGFFTVTRLSVLIIFMLIMGLVYVSRINRQILCSPSELYNVSVTTNAVVATTSLTSVFNST